MIAHSRGALLCAVFLGAVAIHLAAQSPADDPLVRIPSVEERAPQLFGSGVQPGAIVADAVYRMDAQVLLPLWLTSIRIASVRDAGVAQVTVREHAPDHERLVRSIEFFTKSFPERSRGLDRTGLFREVDEYQDKDGVALAYFGGMSRSREQTLQEADRAAQRDSAGESFELLDGVATPHGEVATGYRFALRLASPADADALYQALRPGVAQRPRFTRRQDTSGGAVPTRSFLGALQISLVDAAGLPRPEPGRALPYRTTFVYNGQRYALDLTSLDSDRSMGQTFATAQLAKDATAVYRIRYELSRVGQGKASEFHVWAELPRSSSPHQALVVPLAFEVQPRSFLRLHFERTR